MGNLKTHKSHKKFLITVSMLKSDIDLLAIMCEFCAPIVRKGVVPRREYAYYIPCDKSDFELVQKIFARNGVETEMHKSKIRNAHGEDVLRINYGLCMNPVVLYNTIKKIEHKHICLATEKFKQDRINLIEKLAEYKQKQK